MLKVLVADDELLVREVCRAVLQKNGFVPTITSDGLEALHQYERFSDEIALVISDLTMPKLDGAAFIREIFQRNPKSNVILMTGYTPDMVAPPDLQRVCALLAKPFSHKQLLEAIQKCLKYQEISESPSQI